MLIAPVPSYGDKGKWHKSVAKFDLKGSAVGFHTNKSHSYESGHFHNNKILFSPSNLYFHVWLRRYITSTVFMRRSTLNQSQ